MVHKIDQTVLQCINSVIQEIIMTTSFTYPEMVRNSNIDQLILCIDFKILDSSVVKGGSNIELSL